MVFLYWNTVKVKVHLLRCDDDDNDDDDDDDDDDDHDGDDDGIKQIL